MAVVVQCYNCSNILELDEGFRGGVCRCSQCGSLLQVPKGDSSDSPKARPAAPGAAATVLQRPSAPAADSGLSRGQFDPRSPARPASPADSPVGARTIGGGGAAVATARPPQAQHHAAAVKKSRTLLYVAIGLIGLVVAGVVIGLAVLIASNTGQVKAPPGNSGGAQATGGSPNTQNPGSGLSTVSGPAFLGSIPLLGPKIVFSIDGGQSNMDSFDFLRQGIRNAIQQMAPDQRFIIAVWNGSDIQTYPAKDWASKATLENVWKDFQDVSAHGASDAAVCMKKSVELKGDQTIVVTAKLGLSSDMADPALSVRGKGQRIDALKITSEDTDSPLGKLAGASGGKFAGTMDVTALEKIVNREQ